MNIAFIPVRGGSKSIPLKNIRPLAGKPLVYWTVKAACECRYIEKVFISTDSDIIRKTVEGFMSEAIDGAFEKAVVIDRSTESATDTASTESAMLEFAMRHKFDNIVLIQATSPLLQPSDLERGFEAFLTEGTDSVVSVVRQKRFCWENDERGYAHPTNYDVFHRPRRQEFEGFYVENGAFYITSKESLINSQNRISGNIRVVEMVADSFIEIDEPDDWMIIEALMEKKYSINNQIKIPNIEVFLTDCDGCLTDGGMYYSENGDELKKFNTRDGMGFSLLRERGIITGIITTEKVKLNKRRAEKLSLDILEEGCKDKLSAIMDICKKQEVSLDHVCYIGDDINDIEAIKAVGYGCCPSDAMPQVKEVSKYISPFEGGKGVIRDVVSLLLDNRSI